MKKRIYAAVFAAAAALAVALAYYRGFSPKLPFGENCRYLSDGFFVTGMVFFGVGALLWVTTTGFFDMLTYSARFGLHVLLGFFAPALRKPRQGFYDYKLEREAARKKGRARPPLVAGAAMIAAAGAFLVLYYQL